MKEFFEVMDEKEKAVMEFNNSYYNDGDNRHRVIDSTESDYDGYDSEYYVWN